MTRRQFLVVAAALALLLVAGVLLMRSQQSAWKPADARIGRALVADLRLDAVAVIALQDAQAKTTLARRGDAWHVQERADFPADPGRVRELLVKLVELKVVQTETVADSQRARLQLLEPESAAEGAGTRLELKDAGGAVLARVLLGKIVKAKAAGAATGPEEGVPTGRYAMSGGAPGVVLVSEPLAQADAKPVAWLGTDLIRVERAKSVVATGPDGKQRFALRRDSEATDWTLAGGGKADAGRIQDALSALVAPQLADVVGEPAKADTGLDRATVIRAETFDGLSYTLKIGARTADGRRYLALAVAGEPAAARVPAKGESAEEKQRQDTSFEDRRARLAQRLAREKTLERWTYLVSGPSADPLLRERAQFLAEKK